MDMHHSTIVMNAKDLQTIFSLYFYFHSSMKFDQTI